MHTPRQHTEFAVGILNAMTAHIAVVDRRGHIVAVNEAWTRFALRNGPASAAATGAGANYLEVCRKAEEAGDASAREIRLGIESVLWGRETQFSCEYPCHSRSERRWFAMRVSHMHETRYAVIAHEDITARRLAEDSLRASHGDLERGIEARTRELEQRNAQLREEIATREVNERQLRQAAKVFDSAVEAIFVADAERRIVTANAAFCRITGYGVDEVVGKDPKLLGSGHHDESFYAAMRQSLQDTGQWRGEIWNRRKNGEVYPAWESISVTRDAEGRPVDYVSVFSDISIVKQAEERLAHLAHHDPLTGLANRLLFSARLQQAIERARRHRSLLALLYVDVDRFKDINDSLGHCAGDDYLKVLAERLASQMRAEDTVARLGGDEFAVLVEDLGSAADAGRLADKLIQALREEVRVGGRDLGASVSIGIGLYPADADDGEALLKAADAAMYLAKGEGRCTARFYKAELGAQAHRRLQMESGLRQALAGGQLRLHYQPVVDLESMRCVGLEALLRWQSPDQGWVMPDSFIALAEEARLIQPIGQWVIRQALQDLQAWRAGGAPAVRMSVNVSWRQLNDEGFVGQLEAALAEFDSPRGDIELGLEITESALRNGTQALDDLGRLRERGVRVVIDDFGTGYSSLGQLKTLKVDGLKIDRMFLRDVDRDRHSRAIVRSVIALARGLDLELVGEGVETATQLDFLQTEGCRLAQGFLLGKPVPAAEVPGVLAAGVASVAIQRRR